MGRVTAGIFWPVGLGDAGITGVGATGGVGTAGIAGTSTTPTVACWRVTNCAATNTEAFCGASTSIHLPLEAPVRTSWEPRGILERTGNCSPAPPRTLRLVARTVETLSVTGLPAASTPFRILAASRKSEWTHRPASAGTCATICGVPCLGRSNVDLFENVDRLIFVKLKHEELKIVARPRALTRVPFTDQHQWKDRRPVEQAQRWRRVPGGEAGWRGGTTAVPVRRAAGAGHRHGGRRRVTGAGHGCRCRPGSGRRAGVGKGSGWP